MHERESTNILTYHEFVCIQLSPIILINNHLQYVVCLFVVVLPATTVLYMTVHLESFPNFVCRSFFSDEPLNHFKLCFCPRGAPYLSAPLSQHLPVAILEKDSVDVTVHGRLERDTRQPLPFRHGVFNLRYLVRIFK